MQCEAKPSALSALRHPLSAVFFVRTSIGHALSVILYFLVFLLGAFISHARTTPIFGDQTISKCACNLLLVIEPTGRISLTSLSDLQCHACT